MGPETKRPATRAADESPERSTPSSARESGLRAHGWRSATHGRRVAQPGLKAPTRRRGRTPRRCDAARSYSDSGWSHGGRVHRPRVGRIGHEICLVGGGRLRERGLHNHRKWFIVIDITTIVRRNSYRNQTPALPPGHLSPADPDRPAYNPRHASPRQIQARHNRRLMSWKA